MAIYATPGSVAVDASAKIVVKGPANRRVYWGLTGSNGTIAAVHEKTDANGVAAAVFTPDATDEGSTATITARYGSE